MLSIDRHAIVEMSSVGCSGRSNMAEGLLLGVVGCCWHHCNTCCKMLGSPAFLLQLMVVLLCNLVQDKGGQGSNDCLGPNSTAFLIFVVFRLMLVFFGMMVQAMVCGSLEMKGVMGKLARVMAQCCWVEPERGTGGHCGED